VAGGGVPACARSGTRSGPKPTPTSVSVSVGPAFAGCGRVEALPGEGRTHLQPGETYAGYRSVPPTSGPHAFQPLPARPAVYDHQPPAEALVHNLEHGYVVLWYDALSPAGVAALARIARSRTKVLVTPLEYRDALPGGAVVAVTGWEQRLLCTRADPAALAAAVDHLRGPGSRAPEPSGV
jgi:hypothetical protein